MPNSRKPLIAGNWKMNMTHLEAIALVQNIDFRLPNKYFDKVDVTVIPPFTDIRSVQTIVDGDKLLLTYGAQDLSEHDSGAYTGEISGAFLAKLGCTYVVVGHSERRTYHHEDDALVAAKAAAAEMPVAEKTPPARKAAAIKRTPTTRAPKAAPGKAPEVVPE